jgi:ABC-2 type transport system ATP-binding protein
LADRIAVIDVGRVIAEGTSDDLKARIGGEVLELQLERVEDVPVAVEALAGLGTGEPRSDGDTGLLRLPVGEDGAALTLQSTRRLDERKIPLAGFALHRPTLDDVFLALTGHAAEDAEPSKRRGRRGRGGGGS